MFKYRAWNIKLFTRSTEFKVQNSTEQAFFLKRGAKNKGTSNFKAIATWFQVVENDQALIEEQGEFPSS